MCRVIDFKVLGLGSELQGVLDVVNVCECRCVYRYIWMCFKEKI